MNKEEAIENALKCLEADMLDNTQIELLLNYIDKLQEKNEQLKVTRQMNTNLIETLKELHKENGNYKELILNIKEKLNNIQFEVEQAWRKIEKLENKDE